ncbi:CRE-OSR-1 protein [Aphelenchoides avenae]|nr:CRE-OSR-1 protein [Aphelenchus avenae]
MFAAKTATDAKVKQVIEERPVPPVIFTPQGAHTRLRWTGATEREIPGLGGRFVLPSLDPTRPAVNTAVSTQGKQRDEYDSTFKIPNYWQPGDVFGIKMKTKTARLVGGDGNVDFPAMDDNLKFG